MAQQFVPEGADEEIKVLAVVKKRKRSDRPESSQRRALPVSEEVIDVDAMFSSDGEEVTRVEEEASVRQRAVSTRLASLLRSDWEHSYVLLHPFREMRRGTEGIDMVQRHPHNAGDLSSRLLLPPHRSEKTQHRKNKLFGLTKSVPSVWNLSKILRRQSVATAFVGSVFSRTLRLETSAPYVAKDVSRRTCVLCLFEERAFIRW
mmetsp:Transcript_34043/g.87493  ORF Transcript_34043/g.87493 Transcript_34043/m.87493 type:complete len:204 (-) Transcript_34043:3259-3870(-)